MLRVPVALADTNRLQTVRIELEQKPHLLEPQATAPRLAALIKRARVETSQGQLSKRLFEDICREKSNRRMSLVLVHTNTEALIQRRFNEAMAANNEESRIKALCKLSGVAVPRASSILAWTHPEQWGVIDVRAWRVLYQLNAVRDRADGKNLGPRQWAQYTDILRSLAGHFGVSPQRVDVALYLIAADIVPEFRKARNRYRPVCFRGRYTL